MTADTKRKRGRPTKADSLAPVDRTELWRRQLKQGGGKQLHVNLGASAWLALQALADQGERGPYIERLILDAHRRKSGS